MEVISPNLTPADEEAARLAIAWEIEHSVGRARNVPWIPQLPFPRQKLFLHDLKDKLEAFFGGAAGPGKSSALLMAALEYVDIKGYAALVLRRTYADLSLPEALMERAKEWLKPTKATWNGDKKTWTFPSGATLTFGYLENEDDKYRYQGSAYQCICFDELSQFTETQYLYLFSRLRRLETANVPLRMRSASNPGGVGAEWVKSRFIPDDFSPRDAVDMRVWQKAGIDDNGKAFETWFVPARLKDNPALDQVTYTESLDRLDKVTREQLLHGDWLISPAGRLYFNEPALKRFVPIRPTLGELAIQENDFGETQILFNVRENGLLAIWQRPTKGRQYVMGSDTASGRDRNKGQGRVDADWSVTQVRDLETGEQVARLRGQINERYFGEYNYRLGRWYNNAYCVPGVTGGYGTAMVSRMIDFGYPLHLFYCRYDEDKGVPKRFEEIGYVESTIDRPKLYSWLDTAIIDGSIDTVDAVTINEYLAFEYDPKDGTPRAKPGHKDDCVSADGFAVVGIRRAPRRESSLNERELTADQRYGLSQREQAAAAVYGQSGEEPPWGSRFRDRM